MRQTVLERADERMGLVPCAGTPTLVGAGRIPKVGLRDVGVFRLERDAAEHAIASVAVVDPALRTQIEPVDGCPRREHVCIVIDAVPTESDRLGRAVGDPDIRARVTAACTDCQRQGRRTGDASESHEISIDDPLTGVSVRSKAVSGPRRGRWHHQR
jgi:hypothetical protein